MKVELSTEQIDIIREYLSVASPVDCSSFSRAVSVAKELIDAVDESYQIESDESDEPEVKWIDASVDPEILVHEKVGVNQNARSAGPILFI